MRPCTFAAVEYEECTEEIDGVSAGRESKRFILKPLPLISIPPPSESGDPYEPSEMFPQDVLLLVERIGRVRASSRRIMGADIVEGEER